MGLATKLSTAYRAFRWSGIPGLLYILKFRYHLPIPFSIKGQWDAALFTEIEYWDGWLSTGGYGWDCTFADRLDRNFPLQDRVVDCLPPNKSNVAILDVGAGPLTILGKTCFGTSIHLTAVDAHALHFDRLLKLHNIEPPVRTAQCHAEVLTTRFAPESFDLVYARNCVDHAYDPEKAILNMLTVAKPGGTVFLEHRQNEAEREKYAGLHQWNFSRSDQGDFCIRSMKSEVNMTRKYSDLCTMQSEVTTVYGQDDWLLVRIHKHESHGDCAPESPGAQQTASETARSEHQARGN